MQGALLLFVQRSINPTTAQISNFLNTPAAIGCFLPQKYCNCNNMAVTVTDTSAKCGTMLVTVFYCGLGSVTTTFCLSIPSVPTLCLKDRQMGDDTIYLELLVTVERIVWNKLPGCLLIKDKKNSPSTINTHLLECIALTVICQIYL